MGLTGCVAWPCVPILFLCSRIGDPRTLRLYDMKPRDVLPASHFLIGGLQVAQSSFQFRNHLFDCGVHSIIVHVPAKPS